MVSQAGGVLLAEPAAFGPVASDPTVPRLVGNARARSGGPPAGVDGGSDGREGGAESEAGAGLVVDTVWPLPKPAGPEKPARVLGERNSSAHASLPEHERLATVTAVQDTAAAGPLDAERLFAADLDPERLANELRRSTARAPGITAAMIWNSSRSVQPSPRSSRLRSAGSGRDVPAGLAGEATKHESARH